MVRRPGVLVVVNVSMMEHNGTYKAYTSCGLTAITRGSILALILELPSYLL